MQHLRKRQTMRFNLKPKTRWTLAILYVLYVMLLAGCSSSERSDINKTADKQAVALRVVDTKIKSADESLTGVSEILPQVISARNDLHDASANLKIATEEGAKLKQIGLDQATEIEKLESAFWSPRQKQLAVVVGIALALAGLAIVLMKYGGMWGWISSIPIIGTVIALITNLFKARG